MLYQEQACIYNVQDMDGVLLCYRQRNCSLSHKLKETLLQCEYIDSLHVRPAVHFRCPNFRIPPHIRSNRKHTISLPSSIYHHFTVPVLFSKKTAVMQFSQRIRGDVVLRKGPDGWASWSVLSTCFSNVDDSPRNIGTNWSSHSAEQWQEKLFVQQVRYCNSYFKNWKSVNPRLKPSVFGMKKVLRIQNPKYLREEQAEVTARHASHFNANDIVILISGCKEHSYLNKALLQALVDRLLSVPRMISQLSSEDLTTLLTSLGWLWKEEGYSKVFFSGFSEVVDLMVSELERREYANCNELRPRFVCELINGLGYIAKGGGLKKNVGDLVDGIVCKVVQDEDTILLCKPWIYSGVLGGLANLGFKHSSALEKLCDAIEVKRSDGVDMFDSKDIYYVVSALGKLGFNNRKMLDAMGTMILSDASQFDNAQLCAIVRAFGQLGNNDFDVLDGLSEEIRKPDRLQRLDGEQISSLIYSFGELGFKSDETLNTLVTLIVNENKKLKAMRSQCLCDLVFGLGKLGYDNKDDLKNIFNEVLKSRRKGEFNARGLSNVVYAMGKLGYRDEQALNELCNEMGKPRRMDSFGGQDFANVVFGLATLHYKNAELLKLVCDELCKTNRMEGFPGFALSMLINGFGQLGHKNDAVLSAICGQISKEGTLAGLNGHKLVRMVYTLGKLNYFNADMISVTVQTLARLDTARHQHMLPTLLYGLSLMKGQMDNDFMMIKLEPSLRSMLKRGWKSGCIDRLNGQDVAMFCWGLSELRYYDASIMDTLIGLYLEMGNSIMDMRKVFMMFNACVCFHHINEGFARFLADWFERNVTMEMHDVPKILWGLCVFDCLTLELYQRMCQKLVKSETSLSKIRHASQFLHASCYIQMKYGCAWVEFPECVELLDKAKLRMAKRGPHALESSVQRTLKQLRVNCTMKKEIEIEQGCVLPIRMVVNGDPNIVVEFVDHSHYSINKVNGELHPLSALSFTTNLVEKQGYRVLCAPTFLWEEMGEAERCAWMENALKNLR